MLSMITRRLGVLAVFVIVSISTSLAADAWAVREDGFGPVKIGMSLPQLNLVLHEKFSKPDNKEDQGCFYVNPAKHAHIAFMIENGRLVRIDVDGAGVPTVKGIQVGDSEQRARQVYGARLKVEPHAYTGPEGHYLTIRSSSGGYGIRFETDNGKIETFYAGRFDAIQYVEGCQ
jgi:hypothetical protein